MNALVTGGGGFLGGAIARKLAARGDEVRSFSRGSYPDLDKLGIRTIQGDLTNPWAVDAAVAGCDVVIHVAAKAGIWGPYREYHRANVRGTRNVIEACRRHNVRRLVYTSTPSVVFDGQDQEGIDESTPYARRYQAAYPLTKTIAEMLVRKANDANLATVSLRPHLIWGPGDPHLLPRLAARARAGRLRQIGYQPKLVDATYVDNAADAHIQAADRLAPGSAVAGKVYFISQGEPVPLWDLINRMLATAGAPPVTRRVPARLAYWGGWACEKTYRLLRLKSEPPMTRFVARQLATAHWFDLSAARRDLDYHPSISTQEGLRRLAESFR